MKNDIISAIINGKKTYDFGEDDKDLRLLESSETGTKVVYNNKVYTISLQVSDLKNKSYNLLINDQPVEIKLKAELDILIEKLGLNVKKLENLSQLKAPMPGLVLELLVKVGDTIEEGDTLLILEAMKMENVIKAPGTAVVKSIPVSKGDKVDKSQILMEFE